MDDERWYEGGCHCGQVRFRARLRARKALECNCSICAKKGFLHVIVEPADFQLLRGEQALSTYRFGTMSAAHRFCATCGVHPFYTPRSHPDHVDVNLRCLDDDLRADFAVEPFDGLRWEEHVGSIR